MYTEAPLGPIVVGVARGNRCRLVLIRFQRFDRFSLEVWKYRAALDLDQFLVESQVHRKIVGRGA